MLEVLTPLSKCIRVTRPIDPETFVAAPGFFAWVDTDGSLKDQVTDTVKPINKLVMTSATDNIYESHDIESGRITTLEGPQGLRFKVDNTVYTGSPAQGDDLIVCVDEGKEGMITNAAGVLLSGTYEVIGRVEQADLTAGWIIVEMVASKTVAVTATTTPAP